MTGIIATFVAIKYHTWNLLKDIKKSYTIESDTLAGNAAIKPPQGTILLRTKKQCTKASNTIVGNAYIKLPQGQVLVDTKGQYMKDSNTLVDNVNLRQLLNQVLLDTERQYMKCDKQFSKKTILWNNKRKQIPLPSMRQTIFSEGTYCYTTKGSTWLSKIPMQQMLVSSKYKGKSSGT